MADAVKQLDKSKRIRKGTNKTPQFTIIAPSGMAYFNRAAVLSINALKKKLLFVDLFYDQETERIGFKFKSKKTKKSYKLGEDMYGYFSKVSAGNLCTTFDLPKGSVWVVETKTDKKGIYWAKLNPEGKVSSKVKGNNSGNSQEA